MAKVCINGGGVAGLTTALLLACDGHDVTVVERDGPPPSRDPVEAWDGWVHRGVRHVRQTHLYLPLFRNIVMSELPHVWTRLLEAGVSEHDLAGNPPETISDRSRRPVDDRLVMLLGRRTTIDSVLHNAAEDDPRIEILSGIAAEGLTAEVATTGGGRVTGLATEAGVLEADIVVDCAGARSAMPGWVQEAGGIRPHEIEDEFRIAYWTQWFRNRPGRSAPQMRGLPALVGGPFAVLRCPADNGWWAATIIAPAGDRRYRVLSDQDRLLRLFAALPFTAEWVAPDVAEPVGGILPMFVPCDGRRRYVVDGQPALEGVTAVGDAVAATNPMNGRGVSFAALQARGLRDVLRGNDDPAAVTVGHHEFLENEFHPWWQQTFEADRDLLARMQALGSGQEPPPPGTSALLRHVAQHDPDLWRCLLEIMGVVTPAAEVLARPRVATRIQDTAARVGPPQPDEVDIDVLLDA